MHPFNCLLKVRDTTALRTGLEDTLFIVHRIRKFLASGDRDATRLFAIHILTCLCGLEADILLGHFHKGSVRVRVGQKLAVGDAIAEVGNSGNTSEPHLHINAQEPGTADAPFSGAPIPIRIYGCYLVRNNRFVVTQQRRQP